MASTITAEARRVFYITRGPWDDFGLDAFCRSLQSAVRWALSGAKR